jgi:hypothetical protein
MHPLGDYVRCACPEREKPKNLRKREGNRLKIRDFRCKIIREKTRKVLP